MSNNIETLETEIEALKDELLIAKREAQKARIAKENFIANLSYEIRTPMNSVLGFSHFLLDTALDPEQQENIEDLCSASNKLIDTINNIVDLSKMEAGELKIESTGFNLKNIIDRSFKDIEPLLTKTNISLPELDLYWEDFEKLDGDPNRIKQILINILTTSVENTKSADISFDISIEEENQQEVTLRFEVFDNKTMISEKTIEAMFLKFSDDDITDHSLHTCSGIGLSIAEHLVHLMHGDIGIETAEAGTSYWFTLCFKRVDVAEAETIGAATINKNITILIAEDNSLNQKMITRLLNKENFKNLIMANDGKEALDKVKETTVDLILMDMQMPVMNGLESTDAIRCLESDKAGIPIIALTANAMENDIKKCLNAGMNDHIAKPINKEDLLQKIKKWV
ncbi:MAG: response regulator [Fibrobacterales bacterium]